MSAIAIPLSARYMMLSALGFALMAACVKLAANSGIPVLEIVAARALVSLVLSYLDIKRKGIGLWGQKKRLLMARGITGTVALMCVYYAVTALPLAEATVLQYLHPMFTALIALLVLKERLQTSTLLCIGLGLIGLLVIAQPGLLSAPLASPHPPLAITAALLGALGSAIAYVIVRKLSPTEDASVIIFYFPLIALPFSLLLLGRDIVLPEGEQWGLLILVGVFTQIGQIGLTKAMQTETAAKATAYSYLQIVFAALLGWLIFSEVPDAATWIGGGLILLGALINVMGKKQAGS